MEGEQINIIDNLIEAISILNKTDEYLESLNDRLSECDSLRSDYEHIIENGLVENLDLKELFNKFKENLLQRRKIKSDIALNGYLKSNIGKLQESNNRQFLIQGLKSVNGKTEDSNDYKYRILSDKELSDFEFKQQEKKHRGRPKNVKEGV